MHDSSSYENKNLQNTKFSHCTNKSQASLGIKQSPLKLRAPLSMWHGATNSDRMILAIFLVAKNT